ncbi:MAG TPA: glycosyltransferase family 39 protein [Streptosporangiaceae bacterium]|nr:glycosyltransferase family 39 protein [Streptosporangiaceae bacterium]
MVVWETDLGPEEPAAAVAAKPPGPVTPVTPSAAEPPEPELSAPEAPEPGARVRAWRRWSRALVTAVPMAVTAVTGGYQLGSPSLWRDEAYTKDAIGRPAGQLVAMLGHQDAVHGAYYLLMHVIAGVIGTSATALRLPSLCAMVVAAGFTAAIARRAAGPVPYGQLTGLLAGLLFATAPYMTYYAQMARSYALETMFAAIATYLLIRARPDGRWRWWLGYGAAVALTGLLNIFGLLILAAHGVTLLLTPARGRLTAGGQAAAGRLIGRFPWRWLAVSAAAVAALSPLVAVASHQQQQIAWLSRPDYKAIERLLSNTAGSKDLVLPLALLALGGLAAAWPGDGWRPLNPAAVALPWLVMPSFLLIAASFVKPVYYVRYVEFCLPALAIAAGAGLTGLIRMAGRTPLARLRPAGSQRAGSRWAWVGPWLPAALVLAVLAALLAGPQQAIRQTAARPDNLRKASAIMAARERPGDVVFYVPFTMRVLGTGYPAPFLRLRDIALGRSAIASATLTGTEITSPAELKSRFTGVTRVWVVTGASNYRFPKPITRMDKAKLALLAGAGLRVIGRWQAGEVMLTLYGP